MSDAKKQKSSKLILLLVLILIIAGAGGGYYYWRVNHQNQPAETKKQQPAPIFYQLSEFTVNLGSPDRVLYVGITLRMNDEDTRKKLADYLPEVRSRLLLLFSNQDPDELVTEEGKQKLVQEIKLVLAVPLVKGEPPQVITDVLYTTFILR